MANDSPARDAAPLQVKVVRPSGEEVADLFVAPGKPVSSLKTQIAGFEGIAVGNQVLLLDGRPMEDDMRLSSLVSEASATVVLVAAKPMLAGRLTRQDLRQLLEDDAALERAVDAYAEEPHYSASEVEAIVAAVAGALLPENDDVAAKALSTVPLDDLAPDGAGGRRPSIGGAGGSKRRRAFKQALLCGLRAIADELEAARAAEAPATPATPSGGASPVPLANAVPTPPSSTPPAVSPALAPARASVPLALPVAAAATPVSERRRSFGSVAASFGRRVSSASSASSQADQDDGLSLFRGAGAELRQKLSKRLAASESREGTPPGGLNAEG